MIYNMFKRGAVLPQLRTLFVAAFVLILHFCMTGCAGKSYARAQNNRVEIFADVVSVTPLPTGETAQRKRWEIELRILGVTRGTPDLIFGETVVVRVHSVIKTFGVDADTIKEKLFLIQYADAFSKCYEGDIAVFDLQENKD